MPPRGTDSVRTRKSLIVGVSGFVGNHLARHLISAGWSVRGFDRVASSQKDLETIQGDLLDRNLLTRTLAEAQPQVIFHLAGILKSEQPESFYRVHVLGTETLCEAVLQANIKPLIIIASSSAVYGAGLGTRRITEGFKPRPITHYAISKLAQELIAFRYYQVNGLPVICLRAFNLIGPGQPPSMACSAFAQQIALAELRGDDSIITGNLSSRRDFVDVRDVAHAYEVAAIHGLPGQIYNVCSGHAISIRECLDGLLKLTPHSLRIIVDPERVQQMDVSMQIGSAERLRSRCGWKPEIPLKSSLTDLLNEWRQTTRSQMGESGLTNNRRLDEGSDN